MRDLWIGTSLILASFILTGMSVLIFISSLTKTALATYVSSWLCLGYGTYLGGKRGMILLKNKILNNDE